MPEILTESFCERCGTRYTFEAVAPKTRPLAKLKTVSKGLKNYVLSDDTSLDEAFADARSDEQRAISGQQLDAFHKAFNFCMSCRQYTCANCWNEVEGRCLSCAPHLGREILPGPFPVVDTRTTDRIGSGAGANGSSPGGPEPAGMIAASAWPTVDLRPAPDVPSPGTAPASPVDLAPASATAASPGTIEPAPRSVDERAAAAAVTTTSLLARFRPGRRHEPPPGAAGEAVGEAPAAQAAETGVAEAGIAAPEPDSGLTPAELAEVSAAALAARALRDEASRQPETTSAGPREPEAEAAAPQAGDPVATPAWSIVAPETAPSEAATSRAGPDGASAPPAPATQTDRAEQPRWPQAPDQPRDPQWPTAPEWPPSPTGGQGDLRWPVAAMSDPRPAPGTPAFAPPPTGSDSLWAASSRDVLSRPGSGVQACVSCGLPLSATARFCRRCGSRQG